MRSQDDVAKKWREGGRSPYTGRPAWRLKLDVRTGGFDLIWDAAELLEVVDEALGEAEGGGVVFLGAGPEAAGLQHVVGDAVDMRRNVQAECGVGCGRGINQ